MLTQTELEEEFQVAGTTGEHAVVQGLTVVRVRALFQEQSGQCVAVLMFRLMDGPGFTFAKRAGQCSKEVATLPPEARLWISTVLKQQACDFQSGLGFRGTIQPGVHRVEQGLPVMNELQSPSQTQPTRSRPFAPRPPRRSDQRRRPPIYGRLASNPKGEVQQILPRR